MLGRDREQEDTHAVSWYPIFHKRTRLLIKCLDSRDKSFIDRKAFENQITNAHVQFAKLEMNVIISSWLAVFDYELSDANGRPSGVPPVDRNAHTPSRPTQRVYLKYTIRNRGLTSYTIFERWPWPMKDGAFVKLRIDDVS